MTKAQPPSPPSALERVVEGSTLKAPDEQVGITALLVSFRLPPTSFLTRKMADQLTDEQIAGERQDNGVSLGPVC